MASVTIVQPAVGKVTGGNYGTGQFTVTWSSQVVEDKFIGFRLYCHACNKTIQSSSSNPAVFDIAGLVNSGHPGPFEITANALGAWTNVTIETSVAEGAGTVSPKTQTIRARRGSKITFSISASPAEGWKFEKWTGWGESTSANVAITTTVEGVNPTYRYYAHFIKKLYRVSFASLKTKEWIVGDFESCQYLGRLTLESGPSISVSSDYIDNPTTSPYEKLFSFSLSKSTFYVGDDITISVNMLRADICEAWGIKILGYSIKYNKASGEFVNRDFIQVNNNSLPVTFKATQGYNIVITPKITACYGVKNVVLEVISKAPKAHTWIQSENTFTIIAQSYTAPYGPSGYTGVYRVLVAVSPGAVIDIGTEVLEGDYYIHGYSHDLEDITGTTSGFKWKRLVMPEESLTVTVYVCTDALLYGSHEDLLYTSENALAYGCFVPEGQTVYQ